MQERNEDEEGAMDDTLDKVAMPADGGSCTAAVLAAAPAEGSVASEAVDATEEAVASEAARLMAKDQSVLEQATATEDVATVPLTHEERVAAIDRMMEGPRFREIYFHILDFCQEQRTLGEVESLVGGLPEFAHAGQNQYRLIINLEDAGALDRLELDEKGDVVTEAMKEGLTDDEVDDLVCEYAFIDTDAGREVCAKMQPDKRMEDLMGMFPKRVKTYRQVLDFCKQPRTFKEIDTLLKGADVLKTGSANTITNVPLQPSVFIDQLERSGGLVWKGSWNVTEGGRRYLELMEKLAQ